MSDLRHSPITNRWGAAETINIDAEHVVVFAADQVNSYCHHPQITGLGGRLFATWSNGKINEDDPSQRMLLATSDDMGDTWSEARPLSGPKPGTYADSVVTASGIRAHRDALYAYVGVYEYTKSGLVPGSDPQQRPDVPKATWPEGEFRQFGERTEILRSGDNGATWSEPLGIVADFVPNLRPQETRSGRLIIPGNIMFPYTDDPAGVVGWRRSGIARISPMYRDAPGRFQKESRRLGHESLFCEGSFFQTDDGIIHMMLRTDIGAGVLGVVESEDNGETWGEPMLTAYTDCRSKFHFGRLPDGRCFGLSCPEPGSARTPMIVATSDDGVVFDRHFVIGDEPPKSYRFRSSGRGGRYGYPTYHVADGMFYAIYSISKEDVAVCRLPLSDLD